MIIGISMDQEICLILETCRTHGQVSLNCSIGRKTFRRIYVVRVEIDEKTAYVHARLLLARTLDEIGKACQAEGETKMV